MSYSENKLRQHFAVKNSLVIVQCHIFMKRKIGNFRFLICYSQLYE